MALLGGVTLRKKVTCYRRYALTFQMLKLVLVSLSLSLQVPADPGVELLHHVCLCYPYASHYDDSGLNL